jgi:hypothetical protein
MPNTKSYRPSKRYKQIEVPSDYPGKRSRGRTAYEHHVIYWQVYGVTIKAGEIIHHKNGNRLDNRPENLELLTASDHMKQHWIENKRVKAGGRRCSSAFSQPIKPVVRQNRPRRKRKAIEKNGYKTIRQT